MMELKDEPDIATQLALQLAAQGTNLPLSWAPTNPMSTPQAAHTSLHTQPNDVPQHLTEPPPAHAHGMYNQKPPDFVDKSLLEAAASFLESKTHGGAAPSAKLTDTQPPTSDSQSSIPWALQQQLLQQYGQLMLEKMITKQGDVGPTATATVTTDAEAAHNLVSTPVTQTTAPKPDVSQTDPNSIEAQRDVYRRMLNYSMSNTLAQQYYLQYGYNYIQDRALTSKSDHAQGTSTTTSALGSQSSVSVGDLGSQLPSIDSVLLNLSTKKQNGKPVVTTATDDIHHPSSVSSMHQTIPAYGLQALANAAIEADPKAFSDAELQPHHHHHTNVTQAHQHHAQQPTHHHPHHGGGHHHQQQQQQQHHHQQHDVRKDVVKSELEDVTDTDSSNMSPSDSSTNQIISPPRNTYTHLLDNNPHISIPAAHSHGHGQMPSIYQSKTSTMGTLPSIQHFSAISKPAVQQKSAESSLPVSEHLSLTTGGMKPSDLVAAAMKLKVEASEEKEIADRTIQEQITAHQLNAVHQQQVQDLTASALASGNIDAAALLAKLQASTNLDDLHRLYDHDALSSLQQEPMELTSDLSPGKAASRRKSRGRPTSIESLRDPLGRQSSTTSSLGANMSSISGDGELGDRTYDCEICGKQFSHNDRLRRHRKIHTTDKPYKCDICGKGFKEKCNLKHHRFIHTGEKPYKCDTCAKCFNQRSSLKTHQKVHTGEKPFKCELCEKPFAQKYLLRQHMKKHIELNMPPQNQHMKKEMDLNMPPLQNQP